jgi:hypothetical protein
MKLSKSFFFRNQDNLVLLFPCADNPRKDKNQCAVTELPEYKRGTCRTGPPFKNL